MANKWIASELQRVGRKQVDLAKHLGVSETVLSKMIHTARVLSAEEDRKIREFIRMNERTVGSSYAELHTSSEVRQPDTPPTIPLRSEMELTIPVYGTVLGGSSGGTEFIMNGDSGLRVRRPTKLAGRADIFALFVQGDSMEPRFISGDLIICEQGRPPQIGDFVVVEMKEGEDGYRVAYLKRLVGRSGTKLRLEQYNPAKFIELDPKTVHQVVRVMNTHDILGI